MMPGSITPLPIMLEEEDRKVYERIEPPKSMVLRYGYMRMIAELPYEGDAKPGCGTKLVIRSSRGSELATMLTSTCPNAGCAHAVTRKQMLQYIDNSGGKNYPFSNQGKVLRVASIDDLNEQARLDTSRRDILQFANSLMQKMDLPMKLVDVELLLGGERIVFHYTSNQWVDFRALVRRLAGEYQTRIEMHQVNARDEARLVADYEKCGQHCCCRQFLKVLKPVSMRSAKIQKATLDPTKISGRCGRLMCCLRYEDETYDSLRKRLPRRQTRVMTEDGPGTIVDTQILTQLALVRLDHVAQPQAYPVENIELVEAENAPRRADTQTAKTGPAVPESRKKAKQNDSDARRPRPGQPLEKHEIESKEGNSVEDVTSATEDTATEPKSGEPETTDQINRPRRRRKRRRRGGQK